jgi:hypothetical protein
MPPPAANTFLEKSRRPPEDPQFTPHAKALPCAGLSYGSQIDRPPLRSSVQATEMNTNHRNQFLSIVLKLTVACPHDNSNPPYCPLHEVRKLSVEERMKWAEALSDEEMQYLGTYHQVCLQWRETVEAASGKS